LYYAFCNRFCPGIDMHQPCAGPYTKSTENYCDEMVRTIHIAWRAHARNITPQGSTYIRHDLSNAFVIPGPDGPAWSKVVRRITKNRTTCKTIADEWASDLPKGKRTSPIPGGVTKITTTFYYKD
jgi:hypothetical protein